MTMTGKKHQPHEPHDHQHGPDCGHIRVQWANETAYLHDGHMHRKRGGNWEEAAIPVTNENPDTCQQVACSGHAGSAQTVPHGDHMDVVVGGRLHHTHNGHCDDHGPIQVSG